MTIERVPADLARWVDVLAPARQLAEVIAGTDFVPKAMRGKPDVVTAAIMYGDELGLGPMQALAGMDVVEGKPRPSAELARALILRDGHTLTVHEATGTRVRVSGLRAGRPESERVTIDWTIDMARAAGLVNKSNWRAYPRAMLMARATGDLARVLFPDVIKGLGHLREGAEDATVLDGWAGPATEEPPVAPPVKAIQRRARPGSAPGPQQAAEESPHGSPDPSVPELAPEADPGAEATETADPTEPMRRAMFGAIGRALGGGAQRAERLALCSAILGRRVESSTDLSRPEVSAILDWLDDKAKGRTSWTYDAATETGRVERLPLEPDPAKPEEPWVAHEPHPEDPWAAP